MVDCTEEELIQAIKDATKEYEEEQGITAPQLARLMHISVDHLRLELAKLKVQGKIRVVRYRQTQLDDVVRAVRGYTLVK
jgi:Mn-dependent DtxR family transcriptional regulator